MTCRLFDANGICVSVNAQYSNYNSNYDDSEFVRIVSGALRFADAFRLDANKELTLDGYFRQVESGESPYVAIDVGFKMGF